jgi:hypothetical protein
MDPVFLYGYPGSSQKCRFDFPMCRQLHASFGRKLTSSEEQRNGETDFAPGDSLGLDA